VRGALNLSINDLTGSELNLNQISLDVADQDNSRDYLEQFVTEDSYILSKANLQIQDIGETSLYLVWNDDVVETILGVDPAEMRTIIVLGDEDRELPFDYKSTN